MDERVNGHVMFPSLFDIRQVVEVKFKKSQEPITATVIGIHFYEAKVKYDLSLWLDDNTETRIYNVDSIYVTGV